MSSIYLPDNAPDLPNGVRICLTHASGSDSIHYTTVANELYRVIANDAKAHGVEYDGRGFKKVLEAFRHNKIQAYFLVVERENCLPAYAGGAIQFPTVQTEWIGKRFVHYPAVYSEDTWVDREISDEVRRLTKTAENPSGIGLGTLNTVGRIRLSVAGGNEDLPFGMIARARISENASDNMRQLSILKKLGATLDLEKSAVLQIDSGKTFVHSSDIKVEVCGLGNKSRSGINLLDNVFLTCWASEDGTQQIVGTHTEAISTITGQTIVRSQLTSNGKLPSLVETKAIISSMIAVVRDEVVDRCWMEENEGAVGENIQPIIRLHISEAGLVEAARHVGGDVRQFGAHTMVPGIVNYRNIPDFNGPTAKPLEVIKFTEAYTSVRQDYSQSVRLGALAS